MSKKEIEAIKEVTKFLGNTDSRFKLLNLEMCFDEKIRNLVDIATKGDFEKTNMLINYFKQQLEILDMM